MIAIFKFYFRIKNHLKTILWKCRNHIGCRGEKKTKKEKISTLYSAAFWGGGFFFHKKKWKILGFFNCKFPKFGKFCQTLETKKIRLKNKNKKIFFLKTALTLSYLWAVFTQ